MKKCGNATQKHIPNNINLIIWIAVLLHYFIISEEEGMGGNAAQRNNGRSSEKIPKPIRSYFSKCTTYFGLIGLNVSFDIVYGEN